MAIWPKSRATAEMFVVFFQVWKVAVAHVQKLFLQSMNPMNVFCKKRLGFGIVPPEDLLHKSCPEKEGEGSWNLNPSGQPNQWACALPQGPRSNPCTGETARLPAEASNKVFVVVTMAYRQKSICLGWRVLTRCYANKCGESLTWWLMAEVTNVRFALAATGVESAILYP